MPTFGLIHDTTMQLFIHTFALAFRNCKFINTVRLAYNAMDYGIHKQMMDPSCGIIVHSGNSTPN